MLRRIGAKKSTDPRLPQPLKIRRRSTMLLAALPVCDCVSFVLKSVLFSNDLKRPPGCAGHWAVAFLLGRSAQLQDVCHLVSDLDLARRLFGPPRSCFAHACDATWLGVPLALAVMVISSFNRSWRSFLRVDVIAK